MRRFLSNLRITWNRYWAWPLCRYCGEELYQEEAVKGMVVCMPCAFRSALPLDDLHDQFSYPLTPLPVRPYKRVAA